MTSFLFYKQFDFFISLCKVFKMIAIILEFYFVKSVRMKKVCLFLLALSCLFNVTAQQPQQFSYQTVVRGADNLLVVNKMIGIRISLLQGSENGDVVYVEKHTPTTNANGLASIAIGTGSIVSGNFAAINWSKGPYFIKTETDPAGVSNYTLTTTSQLLSVPYALYAGNGIKRISANSDTIFLSNDSYYINKSSTSTGNSSIPSGGGQNQVLTRCDGELTWTNNGFCPGKISTLDCNYTIVKQGVFVKNDSSVIVLRFSYTGGNLGAGDSFNAKSTNVLDLNASGRVSDLNNGNGFFDVTVSGQPTSSGKANFVFTFCGKSCSFSLDVLETFGKYQSPLTDIDGNEYKTTLIGKQVWMAENLKVTRFNDGTIIKYFVPSGNGYNDSIARIASVWSYYNNDASNNKYGKLYTWYAVSPITNGNKNICPFGWHVPTNSDFSELYINLGSSDPNSFSKKLKQTGIVDWSLDASNSSLFSALPGGYIRSDNYSEEINKQAFWWMSTESYPRSAYVFRVSKSYAGIESSNYGTKSNGLSIRCIKD